jgi:hypothetical protein
MENAEKNTTPDIDIDEDTKRPNVWGPFYLIIGLMGLAFSAYAIIHSIGMVPLYGTVVAGVLIGLLSIVIIIYGYRIMKRDI